MMTKAEAVKWLKSLKQEIGKPKNCSLWHYAEAIDMVIEVMSEPKTGEWIEENFIPHCSECGRSSVLGGRFCPNCVARMLGEDGDEE